MTTRGLAPHTRGKLPIWAASSKSRRAVSLAFFSAILVLLSLASLSSNSTVAKLASSWPLATSDHDPPPEIAVAQPKPKPASPQPNWKPDPTREHGRWVPRTPPYTANDMKTRWDGWYEHTARLPEGPVRTEAEVEAETLARALRIANWEWTPRTLEVPWRTWVTRLRRYPGGLAIVGDSIHLQLIHHLRVLLPPELVTLDEEYAPVYGFNNPDSGQPSRVTLTFNNRTLITFLRDDLLLPLAEVTRLRDEVVRTVPFDSSTSEEDGWDAFTERLGDFRAGVEGHDGISNVVLGDWTAAVPRGAVVLLNTGAHWSPPVFAAISERQLLALYERMVEHVAPKLHGTVLFRPTISGHTDCDNYTQPLEHVPDLSKLDFFQDNGWGLFGKYNDAWMRALFPTAPHAHEAHVHVEERSAERRRFGWLPVWERSLLRPDAHRSGGDCLHVEGPGVLGEWTNELWRVLEELDG